VERPAVYLPVLKQTSTFTARLKTEFSAGS
jgi:hypothetical protein